MDTYVHTAQDQDRKRQRKRERERRQGECIDDVQEEKYCNILLFIHNPHPGTAVRQRKHLKNNAISRTLQPPKTKRKGSKQHDCSLGDCSCSDSFLSSIAAYHTSVMLPFVLETMKYTFEDSLK